MKRIYTDEMGYADEYFAERFGVGLTKTAHDILDSWEKRYGPSEVCTSVSIAVSKYKDPVTAFQKIGGILYNRRFMQQALFVELIEEDSGDNEALERIIRKMGKTS